MPDLHIPDQFCLSCNYQLQQIISLMNSLITCVSVLKNLDCLCLDVLFLQQILCWFKALMRTKTCKCEVYSSSLKKFLPTSS